MKVESTALAGQRETTCHNEKERADTELEFSSWFSVIFLTLVSSSQIRVWCETLFGAHPKMGAAIFVCLLYLPGWCSTASLPLRIGLLTPYQTQAISLLLPGVGRRKICFRWFCTCAEDLGPPVFSTHFSLT